MRRTFDFDKSIARLERMKSNLPIKLANQAQNFFVDSFKKEGFEDLGFNKWKEVQRRTPGTFAYKYPKTKQLSRRTSPILVRSGKLRRATGNSIRQANFNKIKLVVPLKYASVHNEGEGDMPKRKFMGDSRTLRRKQKALITDSINKAWQG